MIKKNHVALLALSLLLLLSARSYSEGINKIVRTQVWNMEQSANTLLQEGLAGSFFGKQGDWFILAGGANFPNGKPWEGGAKTFSDEIFVSEQQSVPTLKFQKTTLWCGRCLCIHPKRIALHGDKPRGISNTAMLLNYNGQDVAGNASDLPAY